MYSAVSPPRLNVRPESISCGSAVPSSGGNEAYLAGRCGDQKQRDDEKRHCHSRKCFFLHDSFCFSADEIFSRKRKNRLKNSSALDFVSVGFRQILVYRSGLSRYGLQNAPKFRQASKFRYGQNKPQNFVKLFISVPRALARQ